MMNLSGTKILIHFLLVSILIGGSHLLKAASEVRIWEEKIELLTYQVDQPDPNPRFYAGRTTQGAQGHVYPYPMSDALLGEKKTQSYDIVYLENEYIKISVIPELGGRIFSAVDKTNGYDFFYRQSVIKPALIGTLGEWISGGSEWNFPHHHKATSMMRMDHYLEQHPDGSATLWLAETELRHRFRISLSIRLYPDKSYIEMEVNPYNPTGFAHSFLYFANPAVHVDSTYQVIFPPNVNYVVQHAKREAIQWPIAEGNYGGKDYDHVDISWWKNLTQPVSFFAWNGERDYFAGYNHGKEAGVAYVADHHQAPGMKFFTFGCGEEGATWDKMLTDTDGPYLELMAGAWSDNQPDYSWAQPYESKKVKQYWFPIRKIGGMLFANLNGGLGLEQSRDNEVKVRINTTSVRANARLVLISGNKAVAEQTADIAPDMPYESSIKLPENLSYKELGMELYSSAGDLLMSYQPEVNPVPSPPELVKPPAPPADIHSVEELFLAGLRLDQFYNAQKDPMPYYQEALKRDPGNYLVNTQLGILDCKGMRWAEAENRLETAVDRIGSNQTRPKYGEANYYLGLAYRAQGKDKQAYDQFSRAAWSLAWNSAARFNLAEMDCLEGNYLSALDQVERSLGTNTGNLRARNLKAVILRKLGRFDPARKTAIETSEQNPLDLMSRYELFLLAQENGSAEQASVEAEELAAILQEETESYLELAVFYSNCGCWKEASAVLMALEKSKPSSGSGYPMVYYYLGYFHERLNDMEKARQYDKQGSLMPVDYCFPYRTESLDVLKAAIEADPRDANALYYLGNLLFNSQPEAAKGYWLAARATDAGNPYLHRNLGLAFEKVDNDYNLAINSYETALSIKKDPRMIYELDILYEKGRTGLEKRKALFEKNQAVVEKRIDALTRQVLVYIQSSDYNRAIELLRHHRFYRWEGGQEVREYYEDAFLMRGIKYLREGKPQLALEDFKAADEYPENLELGRPETDISSARTGYYTGLAYDALGLEEAADRCFRMAADKEADNPEYLYYQFRALCRLREKEKSQKVAARLKEQNDRDAEEDFFAKFGEKSSPEMKSANRYYLRGLRYLVSGSKNSARKELSKALELNPNHYWARVHLSDLPEVWLEKEGLTTLPVHKSQDFPLSDQDNKVKWNKYLPLWDEFESDRLDPEKWWPYNPGWKGRQPAFFSKDNVGVKDGNLQLWMKKEELPEMFQEEGYHSYTSAAVQSRETVLYGYFEVKAKPMLSAGSSSFWFYKMEEDIHTEIDVFELSGKAPGFERKYNMNVHVFRTPEEQRHWSAGEIWYSPVPLGDAFHVYGLEWDKDRIRYYFDGNLVYWVENTHWHQPLTLNFDSETMPDWMGLPDDSDLPSVYEVEYVRAWKKSR